LAEEAVKAEEAVRTAAIWTTRRPTRLCPTPPLLLILTSLLPLLLAAPAKAEAWAADNPAIATKAGAWGAGVAAAGETETERETEREMTTEDPIGEAQAEEATWVTWGTLHKVGSQHRRETMDGAARRRSAAVGRNPKRTSMTMPTTPLWTSTCWRTWRRRESRYIGVACVCVCMDSIHTCVYFCICMCCTHARSQDLTFKIADAPHMRANKVQNLADLDKDVGYSLPTTKLDLALLTQVLVSRDKITEEDVEWNFDTIFTNIASELRMEKASLEQDEDEDEDEEKMM
jgi:hypothetical protein